MNVAAILPCLLAAADASVLAVPGAVDLYVREKYVDASGEKCGSCDPGSCHLSTRAFFLGGDGECFNRRDDRASLYGTLRLSDVVCRQDVDSSCGRAGEFDPDMDRDDCKDAWTIDGCENSQIMRKLEGWCVRSDAPVADGGFDVPLLEFKQYRDASRCGSDDYIHLLLPDEGGACVPLSFDSGDAYVRGSRSCGCDGTSFRAARYDSADCSGDGLGTRVDGSSDQCPEVEGGEAYTNDCVAPQIYCRASPELGGSFAQAAVSHSVKADALPDDEGTTTAAREATVSEGAGSEATSGGRGVVPQVGLGVVAAAVTLSWISL